MPNLIFKAFYFFFPPIILSPVLFLHSSPFLHFISTLILVQIFFAFTCFFVYFYWFSLTVYGLKNFSIWGKQLKLFLLIQFERELCLDAAFCAALFPLALPNNPALGSVCKDLGRRRAVVAAGEWGGDLCPSSLTFLFRLLAGVLCWLWLVCIFYLPHNVGGQGEDTDVSSAIFTSSCFSISLATKTAFIRKNL